MLDEVGAVGEEVDELLEDLGEDRLEGFEVHVGSLEEVDQRGS